MDAATGNVHLEIPLASIPERNGDPLVSKAIFDSSAWGYNGGWGPLGPGWQVFTGNTHSGSGSYNSSYQDCTSAGYSPYTSGQVTSNYFYFIDDHSTSHGLNALNYTKQVSCYNPSTGIYFGSGNDIPSTSGLASDGSGYSFTVTNYTVLQVHAPDGTLSYGDPRSPVDTNGNYSNSLVGSQPDMLGRSPFQFHPSFFIHLCPSSPTSIGIRASDGSTNNYTFTCSSLSVAEILFGTQYTGTESFLTSIGLPDGTQYSFIYDTGTTGNHGGSLLSVTLPDGGVISFTYSGSSSTVTTVTFGGATWNLNRVFDSSSRETTTTVMSPLRYDSVSSTNVSDKAVFVSVPNFSYVQTAQYYSGTSTLLRTVTTTYDNSGIFFLPMTITTVNDIGQSSSVSYQYLNNIMRDYPTQKQETDFTGAVARTTVTQYNGPYSKPSSVNVYAGANTNGTPASSTLYSYDEFGANYCKNGVPGLTNFTGATSHDDTNYGIGWTARGNLTTIQRLISGNSYATTHMCYDTLGNVTQTVDANGNPTSYDYSDSGKWADSFCIPSGTITHAFPTTVTDPLGHQSKYSYFSCTTLKQSNAEQNQINAGKSTTYSYDMFNRPITINFPDGGQITYCYSHDPNLPCYSTALPPFSTTSQLMTASTSLTTKTILDAYGRTIQTKVTSDPDCPGGDKSDTTYDGLGHVLTVSNPYCTTSDPTYGLTIYSYDALGRTTQVANPDGTASTTAYVGSATKVTDESNIQRISQTDALGRLTSLCEVAPGPFVGAGGAQSSSLIGSAGAPASCGLLIAGTGFLTTYQYDPLDNLLQVSQSGIASRTFAYDSLSRLTSSANPESNTQPVSPYTTVPTTYTYDSNGNVLTRAAPAPNQTGTATVTTTNTYDALNRLTQKSYNDGTTPTSTFFYDSSTYFPNNTNTIGRLVYHNTTSSAGGCIQTIFEYDATGRVSEDWQKTPQGGCANTYALPYTYDLMGNMTSSFAPWQNSFTYTYNSAARLTAVTGSYSDSQNPPNLLSGAHYNAAGQIISDTLGTGETETYSYTKRNQLQAESATLNSTTIYSYGLTLAPNGDVTAANDSVNGNWNYSYDQFNRLVCSNLVTNGTCSSPTNGTPTYSYVYDRFGNRWQQNGPYTFATTFTGNATTNNNRMDLHSYDTAGNLLSDGTHTYTYDAENRLISVDNGTTATYLYDADGRRVHRTGYISDTCDSVGKRDYVYDLSGHAIVENNVNGTACYIEVYAGARQLAKQGGGTFFHHSDWLGTVRLLNYYGTPTSGYETCASLPFGDALSCNANQDTLHFTGKERDSESGLDNFGARYNSSNFGRFMSPDPENAGASDDNPQTWNGYAYATDDPMNNTDPDGRDSCDGRDPGGCVEVTASGPADEITVSYRFRNIMKRIAGASQRANDHVNTAWDLYRIACVAAWTAGGGLAGGIAGGGIGGIAGGGGGALAGTAGGPFALVTVPTVALGGAALGTTAGATLGTIGGGYFGYLYGMNSCGGGGSGSGGSGGQGGGKGLSKATRKKLGNLADRAGEKVRDVIRSRGGTAANVNQAGPWADKTLGETAEQAVAGNPTAETAIKIAKQAGRLGQQY